MTERFLFVEYIEDNRQILRYLLTSRRLRSRRTRSMVRLAGRDGP